MTGYYQLSSDTIPIISDSSYWKNKRDIPLTQEEETKYEKTSIRTTQANDTSNIRKYLKITERLTNTINLDYKTTRLKYSGILNPFQLGYSGLRSVLYSNEKSCSSNSREIGNIFLRNKEP